MTLKSWFLKWVAIPVPVTRWQYWTVSDYCNSAGVAWSHANLFQNQTNSFYSSSHMLWEWIHNGYTVNIQLSIHARTAFPCTSGPIKLWQSTHHALVVCLINNVSRQFQEIGCWLVWSKVSVSRVSYHSEQTVSLMGYRLGPCFCNHELSIPHHALLSACMSVCVVFHLWLCHTPHNTDAVQTHTAVIT